MLRLPELDAAIERGARGPTSRVYGWRLTGHVSLVFAPQVLAFIPVVSKLFIALARAKQKVFTWSTFEQVVRAIVVETIIQGESGKRGQVAPSRCFSFCLHRGSLPGAPRVSLP